MTVSMRRLSKIIGLGLMLSLGLLVLMVLAVFLTSNSQSGRTWLEQQLTKSSGNTVIVHGWRYQFPDTLTIDQLTMQDANGAWLELQQAQLIWSPAQLRQGVVEIRELSVNNASVEKLSNSSDSTNTNSGLPVSLVVKQFSVQHLQLAKLGSLAVSGNINLDRAKHLQLQVDAQRLDAKGSFHLQAASDSQQLNAKLSIDEPEQGLIATAFGWQLPYPLTASGELNGPLSAIDSQVHLQSGELSADLQGLLDLQGDQNQLQINIAMPNTQARPDLSWQSLAVTGRLQGRLSQPSINATLQLSQLQLATNKLKTIAATLTGSNGQWQLQGQLAGLSNGNQQADLLQAQPLIVTADARLDLADHPINFSLQHPHLNATGNASGSDLQHSKLAMALTLPDLSRLLALSGVDLHGKASIQLNASQQDEQRQLTSTGNLSITGGDKQLQTWLAGENHFAITASADSKASAIPEFKFDNPQFNAEATGRIDGNALSGNWLLSVKDIAKLDKRSQGQMTRRGQVAGATDNFGLTADVKGELGTRFGKVTFPLKPITATIKLAQLPNTFSGNLNAKAWLAGSALDMAVTASQQAETTNVVIDRATWQSAQLQGSLKFAKKPSAWPVGLLNLQMKRLADLQPLLAQPITGALTGKIQISNSQGQPAIQLQLLAQQLGLAATTVSESSLDMNISHLQQKPQLQGTLQLHDLTSPPLHGNAQLAIAGTLNAIQLQLDSQLASADDSPLTLSSSANLDTENQQLTIQQMHSEWQQEKLHLLNPAQLNFADGLRLSPLTLGLRQAQLSLQGQLSPNLDIIAKLKQLPAELGKRFYPDLVATGFINADAHLTGNPTQPRGNININGVDIKLGNANGAALPALQLQANADLDGMKAQINSQISGGAQLQLKLNGELPLSADTPMNLVTSSQMDLNLFNPLLNAGGRRLRGQLNMNGKLTGSWSQPQSHMQLDVSKTEIRDFNLGLKIKDIAALLTLNNGRINIDKFAARAGSGKLSASGTMDLLSDGLPIDVKLSADNARILASDPLTVIINGDVALQGMLNKDLVMRGAVLVNQAEIRIPEHMPANIAVLKFAPTTPQTAVAVTKPPLNLRLDLVFNAPGNLYVRGRGIDAELYGTVRLRGSSQQPLPDGSFKLRRGEYNLVGKSLVFSQGSIGFNGGNMLDPALMFIATSSSDNISSTLRVDGNASQPTITLSSVPSLPQDEILARLLFKHGANNLSMLEMLQIGSAVASLSGVGSSISSPLSGSLEMVRKNLSLDKLSVGSSLEAGRYVLPGIYLGAKKGIIGNSTQATIQIDITKQLKLEATVGTPSTTTNKTNSNNGNSLGIIYQYDY